MNDDTFGEDPFSGPASTNHSKTGGNNNTSLSIKADMLLARRQDYVNLAESFRYFWMQMEAMSPMERERRLQDMYAQYLLLAPHLGVSQMGLPQLRECCGQKREGLLGDPSETLYGAAMPTTGTWVHLIGQPTEELAWWPGDIIRRITRFFGAPYCEACDRRRRRINSWFGKKY